MISLLRLLYGTFPREVDVNKHKIVHCWDSFVDYINSVNGKVKMPAVSLYSYADFFPVDGKLDHSTAIIDRLFYDYDFENSEGYDALEEARKLDAELNKADWRHFLFMSGGGIHILIQLEVIKYQYPNSTIANFREYLIDKGFRFDKSVVAGMAQMIRIPGTYNLKRKLWDVSITSDELQKLSQSELQLLGKQYRDATFDFGTKLKNLQKFDIKRPGFDEPDGVVLGLDSKEIIPVRPEDIKRECCKILPEASNIQRFLLIGHLVEQGFNKPSIQVYLERVLSPEKYRHCIYEEHQLDRMMERGIITYDCTKIQELSLTSGRCPACRWAQSP